jgi:hypothetical protein
MYEQIATITATSVGSPTVSSSGQITVQGSNVVPLTVDLGPVPTQALATNTIYTSVTICVPDTTTCQTVDHIEVDTGSQGLRVLQSAIPGLALPQLTDGSGKFTVAKGDHQFRVDTPLGTVKSRMRLGLLAMRRHLEARSA